MINFMSPDRIANSICQENFHGIYILVEGIKDLKFFNKFFNQEISKIMPTFGSGNLDKVFAILENRGFLKKIGILDKDFKDIYKSGISPEHDNIFFTDYHDIEIMMLNSKALDNVLNIFITNDKIKDFEKRVKKQLLKLFFDLSDNIGYLKLVEKKYNFGLKFKPEQLEGNSIKYSDFISDKFEYMGDDYLIKSIINYSRNRTEKKLNEKEIKEKYLEEKKQTYNSNHLSNGHDLSNIIFIFLKKVVRSSNKMLQDHNSIEDSLILAYEFEDFKKTQLYINLRDWSQRKNISFLKSI